MDSHPAPSARSLHPQPWHKHRRAQETAVQLGQVIRVALRCFEGFHTRPTAALSHDIPYVCSCSPLSDTSVPQIRLLVQWGRGLPSRRGGSFLQRVPPLGQRAKESRVCLRTRAACDGEEANVGGAGTSQGTPGHSTLRFPISGKVFLSAYGRV